MKKIIILTLITVLFVNIAKTQTQDSIVLAPKNALYVSVGNMGLWMTANVNYERLLNIKNAKPFNKYYLHFGAGVFETWGISGSTAVLSFKWLRGQKNSHLELGLGVASLFDKQNYDIGVINADFPTPGTEPKPTIWQYTDFYPAATIGYRFQKPKGGFVFRTGIAYPDGIYLSVGFAF